ncbi:MAG: lyase family protein [Pseudolysinimonas sp.]|uniref:lyase family protein n=1 Tax=Pseudolysinimonas sp. TaxID=2680009 RepID=UPI003264FD1C
MPSTERDDAGDFGLLDPLWAGRSIASMTSDAAVLAALLRFEVALATVTAPDGVATSIAQVGAQLDGDLDPAAIAAEARAGGNPVIPFLAALRSRLDPDAAHWLHRGATSQDALDTALVMIARDAVAVLLIDATVAARKLAAQAETHRATVITGRTLTQTATPTTLGLKLAGWAWSLARSIAALRAAAAALPVQLGGASGTLAAFTASGVDGVSVATRLASTLRLAEPVAPWHVLRSPITRLADALVELVDSLGTIGRNVAALARVGELDDGADGGSSTMPHKSNPVRAVLLVSAATRAPFLGAALHAAAVTVDERPDGAWHSEWSTLRDLLRLAGGAAATGLELADGLRVHTSVIAANVAAAADDLLAESAKFGGAATPADYLGSADELTTRMLAAVEEELS